MQNYLKIFTIKYLMVNNCLLINLDSRIDLWNKLQSFRDEWISQNKNYTRISGINYKDNTNTLNEFIKNNRINLNGAGFRNDKKSFLGELGCYMGHYESWKYIVENKLDNCLILEDGILFIRNDYQNLVMNKNLDLLFINEEMKINSENQFIGYGLQGYIVSYKGAQKLMRLCFTLYAPIDLQIRDLCNKKELDASIISDPFVKRDNNRESSIDGLVVTDQNNLNDKQNYFSIIQRILSNLITKNINLDDYI